MKISEEKLMDYADGLLSEKEAREVFFVIKNDPELLQIVKDLKEGSLLAKAGYDYAVENAPDPRTRSNRKQESILQKVSNIFNLPGKYIAPLVASLMIIAFMGGRALVTTTQITTLSSGYRSIGETIWDHWVINDKIMFNVTSCDKKRENCRFISSKGEVLVNETITLNLQVLEKSFVSVFLEVENEDPFFIFGGINLIPGEIESKTLTFRESNRKQKIIINYSNNNMKKSLEFIYYIKSTH